MKGLRFLPMIVGLVFAALVLTACTGTAVETRVQVERVAVRTPCPDPAERARLARLRPTPLAAQPMPATAEERVAKTQAQLGRYEARGAWADQVDAALNRCQDGGLTPNP